MAEDSKQPPRKKKEDQKSKPAAKSIDTCKVKLVDNLSIPSIELVYKTDPDRAARLPVTDAEHAYQILLRNSDIENSYAFVFVVLLLLTPSNRVIGQLTFNTRPTEDTFADPFQVLTPVLLAGARRLIIGTCRTHGYVGPSVQDVMDTELLIKTGHRLGIQIIDHIIYNDRRFISFVDRKLILQNFYM